MSGFTALNIDYAADIVGEDDVDNTKEIQIEEALKLYQAALRLHSLGPRSFDKAEEAYQQLLQSDVFFYPESQTDFVRESLYGRPAALDDDREPEDDLDNGVGLIPSWSEDSAPNTLPQILHLSFKNYGRFTLDRLRLSLADRLDNVDRDGTAPGNTDAELNPGPAVREQLAKCLDLFSRALDKDSSDVELWKTVAELSSIVGSVRLSRFCFETVLSEAETGMGMLGLEERLAGQRLNELLGRVGDRAGRRGSKRPLPRKLINRISDDFSVFSRPGCGGDKPSPGQSDEPASDREVVVPYSEWASVVNALLDLVRSSDDDGADIRPVRLVVSAATDPDAETASQVDAGLDIGPDTESPTDEADADGRPRLGRKRSTDSAGIGDPVDGTRARTSKRIRARESVAADGLDDHQNGQKPATTKTDEEVQVRADTDDALFALLSELVTRFGLPAGPSAEAIRQAVFDLDRPSRPIEVVIGDLAATIGDRQPGLVDRLVERRQEASYDPLKQLSGRIPVDAVLNPAPTVGPPTAAESSSFGRHEVSRFIDRCNHARLVPSEVAREILVALVSPDPALTKHDGCSSYRSTVWPADLKQAVLEMIEMFDDSLVMFVLDVLVQTGGGDSIAEAVQAMFELHVDAATSTDSAVDRHVGPERASRAWQWQTLANQAISTCLAGPLLAELETRHLWATTVLLKTDEAIGIGVVVDCLAELASPSDRPQVRLPNWASMPELSIEAAEREIRAIRMRDTVEILCGGVDDADPVETIRQLEPLLEPVRLDENGPASPISLATDNGDLADSTASVSASAPTTQDELKVLISSLSTTVQLALRQRLASAYDKIDYKPMVVSNHLRSLELIVAELKSNRHQSLSTTERRTQTVGWLEMVDRLFEMLIGLVTGDGDPFETVDVSHVRSSLSAVFDLCCLCHSHLAVEDGEAVGRIPVVNRDKKATAMHEKMTTMMQDLTARAWTVFCLLMNEGMSQLPEIAAEFGGRKVSLLSALHESLGCRSICKAGKHVFVRFLQDEFLRLWPIDGSAEELIQVLFDLYDLSLSPAGLAEHGSESGSCSKYCSLETETAIRLIPFVTTVITTSGAKDIAKADVQASIDRINDTIGLEMHKQSEVNGAVIDGRLRGPVRPADLFSCLDGTTAEIDTRLVGPADAPAASSGWYFLIGSAELAKFQAALVRQGSLADTKLLDCAARAFLRDLAFSVDRWESWYRLAQTYEAMLTDKVSWTIEKLNANDVDIFLLQRRIVHCYTLAVAAAVRSYGDSTEFCHKLAAMCADFANRLYDCSRQPFSMRVFDILAHEQRSLSCGGDNLERTNPFSPPSEQTVWRIARVLLERSIRIEPDVWQNHYMLSKCLWKLFQAGPTTSDELDWMDVIAAIVDAIDRSPQKSRRDPVLEPHYRLVSVVYKLVKSHGLAIPDGYSLLQASRFSRKSSYTDAPVDEDEWEGYMLDLLKQLRLSDKENWHHRITLRAARVLYEGSSNELGWFSAKHELSQKLFNRQMAISFWRTTTERPGRHYVYASRYTCFMAEILDKVRDKTNFDLLLRRMRKRGFEYYGHTAVWNECAVKYVKLLRRIGDVPESMEDSVFKNMSVDEWTVRSPVLDEWCRSMTGSHPILDLMRDTLELKKLNGTLMKNTLMDDLLGDAYAVLYSTVAPGLDIPTISNGAVIGSKDVGSTVSSSGSVLRALPDQEPSSNSSIQSIVPTTTTIDSTTVEPIAKPRAKGIGRREVHKKAEMAASRSGNSTTPSTSTILDSNMALNSSLKSTTAATTSSRVSETKTKNMTDVPTLNKCLKSTSSNHPISSTINTVPEDDSDCSLTEIENDEDEDEVEDEEVEMADEDVQPPSGPTGTSSNADNPTNPKSGQRSKGPSPNSRQTNRPTTPSTDKSATVIRHQWAMFPKLVGLASTSSLKGGSVIDETDDSDRNKPDELDDVDSDDVDMSLHPRSSPDLSVVEDEDGTFADVDQ